MAKGGKKKGTKEKAVEQAGRRAGLRPLRLGILAAVVIAGPPLYRLVQQGSLDSTTAITKAGIVALAVAIGVSWLRGLVVDYQADVELERRRKANRTQELLRMIELENAAKAAEAAAAQNPRSRRGGARNPDPG